MGGVVCSAHVCPLCLRSFTSRIGLGLHKKSKHPAQYNEEIMIAGVKPRWTDEELRLLAMKEARAPVDTRAINSYLMDWMGGDRSLEAIKGIRKRRDYRELVLRYKDQLIASAVDDVVGAVEAGEANPEPMEVEPLLGSWQQTGNGEDAVREWLRLKHDDIIPEMNGGIWIRTAIGRVLDSLSPDRVMEDWWTNTFSDLCSGGVRRRTCRPMVHKALSKRKARRREYKKMQLLWRKNMSKAARKVLDGDADGLPHPSLLDQVEFWKPVFELVPDRLEMVSTSDGSVRPVLEGVWAPITEAEVISIKLPAASAPGLDGMTVKRWMSEVPAIIRAALFNIFIMTGTIPHRFLNSRTVLIPKTGDLLQPSNYRPISVASVVLRHFHKILAVRLSSHGLLDNRQRGFISADGCAENVAVLSSVLLDARTSLKPVHVVTLDVRKAFDTVSHLGIYEVLIKYGLPSSVTSRP